MPPSWSSRSVTAVSIADETWRTLISQRQGSGAQKLNDRTRLEQNSAFPQCHFESQCELKEILGFYGLDH